MIVIQDHFEWCILQFYSFQKYRNIHQILMYWLDFKIKKKSHSKIDREIYGLIIKESPGTLYITTIFS